MLARLPGLRAKEIIAALENAGFQIERQKGSHVTLRNPETRRTTVVPIHSTELPRWLMKKIIKDAGMSEDDFRMLLYLIPGNRRLLLVVRPNPARRTSRRLSP